MAETIQNETSISKVIGENVIEGTQTGTQINKMKVVYNRPTKCCGGGGYVGKNQNPTHI